MKNQYEIQKEIQQAGYNIITCGNCGGVILIETHVEEIKCPHCELLMEQSDCPDLYYE